MTFSFKNVLIVLGITFGIFLLLRIMVFVGSGDSKTCDKYVAVVKSERVIKSILKSPSTAEFPNTSEYTIATDGDTSWTVIGYVDAQNGFGAMLRSQWIVDCKCAAGKWEIKEVEFDGKKVF